MALIMTFYYMVIIMTEKLQTRNWIINFDKMLHHGLRKNKSDIRATPGSVGFDWPENPLSSESYRTFY